MSSICAAPLRPDSGGWPTLLRGNDYNPLSASLHNQARISRSILRLELADAFEVSRVCDDTREFLELIELIQLRVRFFTAVNSAHRLWSSVSHHSLAN
jgi:hypothetical protein